MSTLDLVNEVVGIWCKPYPMGEFVVVPTYQVYPSNSCVQIYVEGGRDTFVVSDGGGALQNALILGRGLLHPRRHLKAAARDASLGVNSSGWLYARGVDAGALTSMISVVAEASKSAAFLCAKHFRPEAKTSSKMELDNNIETTFRKKLERKITLIGASNKPHNYDFGIKIDANRLIVIDAVSPEANSINSAIVSHLDLKNAHNPKVSQRLVYDDRVKWRSSDLSLLSVGATPIAYTRALNNLERLVA